MANELDIFKIEKKKAVDTIPLQFEDTGLDDGVLKGMTAVLERELATPIEGNTLAKEVDSIFDTEGAIDEIRR